MVCRRLGKGATTETMLEGSRTDPRPAMHSYKVTVVTSDSRNAGTDADVFIDIQGLAELLCTLQTSINHPSWKSPHHADGLMTYNNTAKTCVCTVL